MKYTRLGTSDLTVSRICMGCMGFGDAGQGQHAWTLDEAHSREIIRYGLEMGINFYDTAIAYQSGTRWSWPRSSCPGRRTRSRTA